MKYVCGLPFVVFETWCWVPPWGNRVLFLLKVYDQPIGVSGATFVNTLEAYTVKCVWTIFWAEKGVKILVKIHCHLLVKHMKAITFCHTCNIEILSCVPLSARSYKMKVILQLCCVMLNMCLWKPFCLNMVFWGSTQAFLSFLEPLIRCHFFVVVFSTTILNVDCEWLYYSQCINLLPCHVLHTVFTDLPFLVTF